MIKKALVALAISGMALSAHAGALLVEGFENVNGLAAKGWVLNNASTPPGTTSGWAQGSEAVFAALDGPAFSYASANYNNAEAGGILNNWLITPEFSTGLNGAIVSFSLRAQAFDGFHDLIAFGFGSSTDLASFVMSPLMVVGTDGWMRYEARIAGDGTNRRFAIQYGGEADFANFVGVDQLLIAEVPEPSSVAILLAGVAGLTMSRRRKRG
jgi:hypothetical protein